MVLSRHSAVKCLFAAMRQFPSKMQLLLQACRSLLRQAQLSGEYSFNFYSQPADHCCDRLSSLVTTPSTSTQSLQIIAATGSALWLLPLQLLLQACRSLLRQTQLSGEYSKPADHCCNRPSSLVSSPSLQIIAATGSDLW